jgi:hypothetical protein
MLKLIDKVVLGDDEPCPVEIEHEQPQLRIDI